VRVVPVHAYGIAGTLKPKDVTPVLGNASESVRVTKTMVIVARGGDRYVAVHDFGAVVFFGHDEAQRKEYLDKLLATVAAPEPHPPVMDDFLVEVREGAAPETSFDRAIVPELDVPRVEILSLVLAQSVAMDYYDEDVELLYRRIDQLCVQLAQSGRLRLASRDTQRFIGRILITRNQIAMTLSLLDAPIVTWESESLDRLYRAMRATFETEDRYRTLTHKLGLIQDDLEIVVDLVRSRRGFFLEVAVVVMIAIEIVLALLQMRHG
jgi:uncharacterized Rmd1/YagE family protein